ncbi:MAG: spiro-SPASM protein [Spirochaetales bacterium]|nr:spiro-SPASM protein [Spirochaetales bacterium]
MKNIAIINGVQLSPYVFSEVKDGRNSLALVSEYVNKLPDVQKAVLLCKPTIKDSNGFDKEEKEDWTLSGLLETFKRLASGYDTVFYFYADCPLLDPELSRKMYENHHRYFADYTFADGYPYGITPEILKPAIINQLIRLMGETDSRIKRDSLFEIIKHDINNFDIETEISPKDLRLLRLNLASHNKRDYLTVKKIVENGGKDAESIREVITTKRELLRSLPAFFNIQIAERCPQTCTYCPYPSFTENITSLKGEMAPADFNGILDKIVDFCDDAVISFSLWGDPSSHSRIAEMIHSVLKREKLDLIIETSGLGWNESTLSAIACNEKRFPSWILSLDAWTQNVYNALRGQGFEEANRTKDLLLELFPDNVYLQAVRMTDNEDDLEHFYLNHKKITENIIIQKYDSFCGALPDRKVTDLSPLKRIPCWHLIRDVTVLLDGTVLPCREDIKKTHVMGNILKDDLASIWSKGEDWFMGHLREDYPDLCKMCDEYYTYNF